MIVDERMLDYILSLDRDESPLVRTIEQEAVRDYVPIIRKESRNLLKVLLKIKKPGAVLEVGTAIGFSAVLMAECLTGESHITTIEKYEKRIPIARRNFQRAGMEAKITLLEGDAAEVMKGLDGPYDFIFMDAAKGQYIRFLPEVLRLLAPGGLLVSDNVLQDGDVVESRYAVVRRNRTIHSRMREYLWTLKLASRIQNLLSKNIMIVYDPVADLSVIIRLISAVKKQGFIQRFVFHLIKFSEVFRIFFKLTNFPVKIRKHLTSCRFSVFCAELKIKQLTFLWRIHV